MDPFQPEGYLIPIKMALQYGLDVITPHPSTKETPIFSLLNVKGDFSVDELEEVVRLFVEKKADINHCVRGRTVLMESRNDNLNIALNISFATEHSSGPTLLTHGLGRF